MKNKFKEMLSNISHMMKGKPTPPKPRPGVTIDTETAGFRPASAFNSGLTLQARGLQMGTTTQQQMQMQQAMNQAAQQALVYGTSGLQVIEYTGGIQPIETNVDVERAFARGSQAWDYYVQYGNGPVIGRTLFGIYPEEPKTKRKVISYRPLKGL